MNPFPTNHCSAFFYSRSFSCALYSEDFTLFYFEDMNILIKVKLFGLKNRFFFGESFYLKKKVFENKNNVFEYKKFKK